MSITEIRPRETSLNLPSEQRRFPPPRELAAHANMGAGAYAEAEADRLGFWASVARRLDWAKPWDRVLDWNPPFASWYPGGELNVTENCLDRHVKAGHGDQIAYLWEGEPADRRSLTYRALLEAVCRTANALLELGVRPGDRVAIYLPMIPELPISVLACARIGAPHTVVFGGFSADSLRGRILDCDARVVVTADGGYRRGAPNGLKQHVDEALKECPAVRSVLVVRRTGQPVSWHSDRDLWWHDIVDRQPATCPARPFPADHPLFILYTSGTTAKPKGILHTCGGYLAFVSWTHWAIFDIKPERDVYWCTADIGWVTGHSYIIYGPLSNRTTSVIYEGTPDTPNKGRFWEIVDRYRVSIFYAAPTTIRTFMKWGEEIPSHYRLSSLRLLGTVGEPINPEAWMWYRRHIGRDHCPIVDTWWQTETGGALLTPLPGVHATKPGSVTRPLPGIVADIVDDKGQPVPRETPGYLVLKQPWPGMMRTIWGDDRRYRDTYWARFPGLYFAGDGAKRDADGDFWLLGRVDDVLNVSGHRISATEVESALVAHPMVAEAAVVAASDPTTGQAIVAFVIPRGVGSGTAGDGDGVKDAEFARQLRAHVAAVIGPIAKPRQVVVVPELPKTRSGKIMRRLLRDIAEARPLGDVTTLTDSGIMGLIRDRTRFQT